MIWTTSVNLKKLATEAEKSSSLRFGLVVGAVDDLDDLCELEKIGNRGRETKFTEV